ncbi:glutathione peroxidase [Klebsiella quasipneumoniae]|nr:glutathione peroxidase [Klebsiella quasipneumoniae]
MQHDILNTEVTTIDGEKTTLASFAGKVLLIVNVASKCGLTPQYEQLEDLQKQFAGEGFSVLGFPCNQFLGQEPGSEEEIKTFCSTTYGVTFPLFSKIDVNGEHRAPLYQKLVAAAPKAVAPEGSGFYERMASKGRGAAVRGRHSVEFRKIPRRSPGQRHSALLSGHDAGRSAAGGGD